MAHFDLTGSAGADNSYATLPGTAGDGFVERNNTAMKARFFSNRKQVAGRNHDLADARIDLTCIYRMPP